MTTPCFIDSHAHIDAPEFADDRDDMLARASAAGVDEIVVVGAAEDIADAERTVAAVAGSDRLWASVGVHPHHASRVQPAWWPRLRSLCEAPRVVAVGETGLDYHYDLSPRDDQRARFAEFLDLARDVALPVICHIRDAHDDARDILARGGVDDVIIHCFTGSVDDARDYAARGYYVSFSGIVTFKSAGELRDAVRVVPRDRLLIETDCPYLAPIPVRGQRNEPAYLVHTARVVAEAAGVSLSELAVATADNTRRVFKLPATARSSTA